MCRIDRVPVVKQDRFLAMKFCPFWIGFLSVAELIGLKFRFDRDNVRQPLLIAEQVT